MNYARTETHEANVAFSTSLPHSIRTEQTYAMTKRIYCKKIRSTHSDIGTLHSVTHEYPRHCEVKIARSAHVKKCVSCWLHALAA
jgi:hypothetical protein